MRQTRLLRSSVVVALLCVAPLVPGAATAAEPGGVRISTAPSQLVTAERQLATANAAVRTAVRDLDELEARQRAARDELAALAGELDTATAGLTAARATEERAAADVAAADAVLADAQRLLDAQVRQVSARAVEAFKYGSRGASDLVFRGISSASDLHDAAIAIQMIDRLSHADQQRVADTMELVEREAEARARAEAVRATAAEATGVAEQRRAELATLRERKASLAAAVEREHDERARVLAALEADAEARQAIVDEVAASLAALEGAAVLVRMPVQIEFGHDGAAPDWAALLPAAGQPYAATIAATAAARGIDGRLLAALVWTESGFRPGAVSHAGAIGLAQLMPGTARGLGVDPYDVRENLAGGARFLAAQLDTFGRVDLALAAYNAGPGRVAATGGIPAIVETQLYVVRVLDRYRTLTGA